MAAGSVPPTGAVGIASGLTALVLVALVAAPVRAQTPDEAQRERDRSSMRSLINEDLETLMNTPIEVSTAFAISVGSTLVALVCAGSAKTWMTGRRWLRSGLETMLIGAIAAAATFLAGRLIAA